MSFAGIAALWLLGVTYLFEASWFSGLGNISRPLGWMALGALSLFVLVPRERMGISKSAFGVMLFIGTAGLLVANIRSGSKAFVMFSFIPLIWMLLVRRDLRRWSIADRNWSPIVLLRRRCSRSGAFSSGPGTGRRDRLSLILLLRFCVRAESRRQWFELYLRTN